MKYTMITRPTPYGYNRYHITLCPDVQTTFTVCAYDKKAASTHIKEVVKHRYAYPPNHFEINAL